MTKPFWKRSPKWKNWAGNVRSRPNAIYHPVTKQDILTILRSNNDRTHKIRVAGSGHSYSSLVPTDEILLLLNRYNGLTECNFKQKTAVVKSGTRLRDLGPLLWEAGLAMENLGDTDAQTIGGAISTGTHGSGITFGSLSTQISELTLLTAQGEEIVCSPNNESDIFKAAQVSLGLLGVIAEIKLQLRSKFHVKMEKGNQDVEAVLSEIDNLTQRYRHYEFWYWPHTRIASVRATQEFDGERTETFGTRLLENLIFENLLFWTISQVARVYPPSSKYISRIAASLNLKDTDIGRSYRILATPRHVRLLEMEYAVPREHGPECLRRIMALIDELDIKVHFPIQYRYVAKDDIYLSPYYERDSALIDIQMYKGMKHEEYFRKSEQIFREFDGRPHWGKLHFLSPDELKECYPKWEDFHRIREQLDPKHVFMNTYLERLFL